MNDELKQLVEDAAKLLGWKHVADSIYDTGDFVLVFNPLNPERGDLMKVAMAAELSLRFGKSEVTIAEEDGGYKVFNFTKGDYQSLALAILRVASAVLHSRRGVW